MKKKSHLWRTALLLLILASGCVEEKSEAVQRAPNEKHKPDPTLEADKPPQMGSEAESAPSKVIAIKDGDTIVVVKNQKQITIRLEGIDCPESGQAFGKKAKQAASGLCFGKTVTVKATGKDRYGRTLAHVILPDGRGLSGELVRQGLAWWYRKYSKDKSLGRLKAEAREQKRDLMDYYRVEPQRTIVRKPQKNGAFVFIHQEDNRPGWFPTTAKTK